MKRSTLSVARCSAPAPVAARFLTKECLNPLLQQVTDSPECGLTLLFGALNCSRVFQAPMNSLATAWKYRAIIPCVVTYSHNVIERVSAELIDGLRAVP